MFNKINNLELALNILVHLLLYNFFNLLIEIVIRTSIIKSL